MAAYEGFALTLEAPGRPLARRERTWGEPPQGLALLRVLGCGVCHTDLGYATGAVKPKAELPLVLGHEIVGRVLSVGGSARADLVGRRVLAPAVSPCAVCAACRRGRATACPAGRMPGNDADGGFATHVFVPARDLFPLDARAGADGPIGSAALEVWEIAPVADAVSTAWQALVRAGLTRGDVAVFVGVGGVGGFGAQLAKAEGASVIAVDVDGRRLAALEGTADELVDASGLDPRALRDRVRSRIHERGWREAPTRVFETSGTAAGQAAAFELLDRGGSLSVVGFTMEKLPLRLSNVMALDADVHGNWGCDPALYAGAIERVLDGRVRLRPFVERRPLAEANDVLDALAAHRLSRRAVLVP